MTPQQRTALWLFCFFLLCALVICGALWCDGPAGMGR